MIANIVLQNKLIEVFEKVKPFEGNNTQNRRVDVIIIENNKDHRLILEPTIRLETNPPQQEVQWMKKILLRTVDSTVLTVIHYHKLGSICTMVWN